MSRFEMRSGRKRSVASPIRMSTMRTAEGSDLMLVRQLFGARPSLLGVAAVDAAFSTSRE